MNHFIIDFKKSQKMKKLQTLIKENVVFVVFIKFQMKNCLYFV